MLTGEWRGVAGGVLVAINWTSDKRRLADLTPWDNNPRQLKEAQAEHLEVSLDKFGLAIPFLISPDNEIYDGHQRQALMRIMGQYGADALVDVRVSDRPLTMQERKELVIRLHENTGEWDFDTLANVYEPGELAEWGFPEWKLPEMPSGDDWGEAFGNLPEGDRAPFQQMTFTLHDEQVQTVASAVKLAKSLGPFDGPNENSNGNALARICELFEGQHGQG